MDEDRTPSQSITLTDKATHPVCNFLRGAGLDVADFPVIRFRLELPKRLVGKGHVFIPVRVPGQGELLYESFVRVIRTMEIPNSNQPGHRYFVECEWLIEDLPVMEGYDNQLLSFLSDVAQCPSCRSHFTQDPAILTEGSLRITCPECLHYWTLNMEVPPEQNAKISLLTDLRKTKPSEFQKLILNYENQEVSDRDLSQYFVGHFESSEGNSSSLEWLFGSEYGFALRGLLQSNSFEDIARSFFNHLAYRYFSSHFGISNAEKLEQTEIQQKTNPSQQPTRALPNSAPVAPAVPDQSKGFAAALVGVIGVFILSSFVYYWFVDRDQVELAEDIHEEETVERSSEEKTTESVAMKLLADDMLETDLSQERTMGISHETSSSSEEGESSASSVGKEVESTEEQEQIEEKETAEADEESATNEDQESPVQESSEADPVDKEKERKREQKALADAGFRQGMLHLQLEQAEQAAEEFENVLALDPSHKETYRHLGLAYVYDRRFEDAIEAFENYLEFDDQAQDRESVKELLRTLRERVDISSASR